MLLPLGVAMILALSGCASMYAPSIGYSPAEEAKKHTPKPTFSEAQEEQYKYVQNRIKTKEGFLFHEAAVAPDLFKTSYPLYLLGFEKPRDGGFTRPYCNSDEALCNAPKFNPKNFKGDQGDVPSEITKTQKDINQRLFFDSRPLVLTHVLSIRKQSPEFASDNQKGCFVFNLYGHDAETAWCKNHYKADIDKPDWKREGWKGMDQLAIAIKEEADRSKATHIIMLATGWNTRQYESYLDFKAWIDQIAADFNAANTEFRPIFLGIAWESEWAEWSHLPFVSVFNKGNDADEMGYGWINYLLNDLNKPIAKATGVQLAVIGHSFGSRIALGSHYVRHILDRSTVIAEPPITIIGMQAAFPIARFISTKGKEHQYVSANKGKASVIITSSIHDSATGGMCTGTSYVGAGCGAKVLREQNIYHQFVTVMPSDIDGEPAMNPDPSKVTVYDVSPFVRSQLAGTHSGAHSDVYDKEMGHFLGEIIRKTR